MRKEYVFGPVSSRRLGVSLGVDPIRSSVCTLDCIYCEAGRTRELSCHRREFAELERITGELDEVLKNSPELDYITFSGIGEPTLYSRIDELAQWIKNKYPQYKICLLTNGTLLKLPEVRRVLEFVDIAMPNFDASNDQELAEINRPAPGINVEGIAEGIRAACREYPGKLVLELFVVPGVNDSDVSIGRFAEFIASFEGLHSVQLNTLDRPGAVDWITPAPVETLRKFIDRLEKIIPVEAVGRYRYRSQALRKKFKSEEADDDILALTRRRPATAEDLALTLGIPLVAAQMRAEEMVKAGILSAEKRESGTFYAAITG